MKITTNQRKTAPGKLARAGLQTEDLHDGKSVAAIAFDFQVTDTNDRGRTIHFCAGRWQLQGLPPAQREDAAIARLSAIVEYMCEIPEAGWYTVSMRVRMTNNCLAIRILSFESQDTPEGVLSPPLIEDVAVATPVIA